MLHIKALIKTDEVLIFDTSNPEYASRLSLFMYDLESKLRTKVVHGSPSPSIYANTNQPYEFRALECILVNVMAILETELQHHLKDCHTVLNQLDQEIDRGKLRDLLVYSKRLTTFNQKALLIRNSLDELLDNDEDLEDLMELTEQREVNERHRSRGEEEGNQAKQGQQVKADESSSTSTSLHTAESVFPTSPPVPPRPASSSVVSSVGSSVGDTGDIEMLLEAYYQQCDEIVQQAETLINDIKSTEEIVNIILDANRNSLMVYELKITIYTLGFTMATLMPAFYGMNLKNYMEESPLAFGGVIMLSCVAGMTMVVYAFRKLRLVQKMSTVEGRSRIEKRRIWLRLRREKGYSSKMRAKKEKQDVIWKWLVGK
ncbi:DEKNAAC104077 [Brettanomyces naardenensis]|uniref:Magnesium transporter n=1 Tax=Brettanomyces naardenensis TaxID=13370 RepID=A0A448YQK0_BRENA|nr:DEKNAAC104077 [Brettanomyces naardenensis]